MIVGTTATAQAAIHTGKSNTRLIFSTGSAVPLITAQRGRISVVSMMFAPMMLPTESDDSFLRIAVRVVTSSGSDVPRAITVKPIIVSLMPIPVAIVLPDETRNSAPNTIEAVPRMKKKILEGTSFFSYESISSEPAAFLPSRRLLIINTRKIAQRINADQVGSIPLKERTVRPIIAPRRRIPFNENSFLLITPAIATRETPIISVVLAVTEPTALPIASCAEPFIAARTDTKSSGNVVAKETTVAPTTTPGNALYVQGEEFDTYVNSAGQTLTSMLLSEGFNAGDTHYIEGKQTENSGNGASINEWSKTYNVLWRVRAAGAEIATYTVNAYDYIVLNKGN